MGHFGVAIHGFVDETKDDLNEVTIKSVLELRSRLIVNSPVDTGRFRANWQYGLDTAPGGVVETKGTSESPAPAPATPNIAPQAIGHTHILVNNVPYANRIEDGWSDQAPKGVVSLRVQEWPSILDEAVASVRR